MRTCERCSSGELELYFYDELPRADRSTVEQHLSACRECRAALDELHEIRAALASRPDVSAPASGDWSAFMSRLDASLVSERPHPGTVAPVARVHSPYVAYLAMAALLTLVTVSVMVALRSPQPTTAPAASSVVRPATAAPAENAAFTAMTEEHFEKSKLVVLGLATKTADQRHPADWAYERELATSLLNDTRLYRLAAEDRGLDNLAGVMRDLELVLLQTSLTDANDPASLPQLQRLIRHRDLIEKMDVVATKGL